MYHFIFRAIAMYLTAMVVIRLMGKRALGELGLFDFVVMTGVGHILTSVALDQSLPFYEGVGVLAVLAIMEYLTGILSLKNQNLAHIISGKPVVMIENGKIIKKNLAREKFNVDDLLQELRKQGIRDVAEVEKGMLEPSGGFSVILKGEAESVTRGELGIEWTPDADSILTYQISRREEVFDPKVYPNRSPDTMVLLPDVAREMTQKLDEVINRLNEMEKRLPGHSDNQ
ncbi:MAG: DUF421 domain-containing protein [Chitinophagales bacterium]